MSWIDYVIISVTLVSVVISFFRGLIREVMALVIWVIAFWIAFQFADNGAMLLTEQIPVPSARMAVAFGGLFIATLLLGAGVNFLLTRLVESTGLTGTDRFLGMFFGAARALVMITAAVMFAGLTPLPRDPWWQESVLLPRFQGLAQWATTHLPLEVQEYFDYQPPTEYRAP